jgi:hypothetical protein
MCSFGKFLISLDALSECECRLSTARWLQASGTLILCNTLRAPKELAQFKLPGDDVGGYDKCGYRAPLRRWV